MRRLLLTLASLVLLWSVGLAAFITRLPEPALESSEPVDGIVVYTGGGGARISAGMSIFASGAGKRLLISGVHENTSRERLSELWPGDNNDFSCCVDLGRDALTTGGNAKEASDWLDKHNFKSIVLVTSEFHMPRALTETRAKIKDVEIIPYTVRSGYLDQNGQPNSKAAWNVLSREYTKYVAAQAKALWAKIQG